MIGSWVARSKGDVRLTKAHLVESEIADRKVTRCGRQLGERQDTELVEVHDPAVSERCQRCDRGRG